MNRWALTAFIGIAFSLGGCSTLSEIPDHYFDLDRQGEYPLAIVPAQYQPEVVMDFDVTGKGSGAIQGAGRGMMECLNASEGGGDFAALAVLLCMPLGAAIGGIHGAITAESVDKITEITSQFKADLERVSRQETIAQEAAGYLNSQGIQADIMAASTGPRNVDDLPRYAPGQFKGYGGILELRVLELHIASTGKKGSDLCLSMELAARKIDGHTGQERDLLQRRVYRGCDSTESWMRDGGKPLLEAIETGYALAAKDIIDEFYFIYYPPIIAARSKGRGDAGESKQPPNENVILPSIPTFVLRPIQPPLTSQPEANIFASAPKHRTAVGGLQFTDVKTLSPRFEWEPFPRTFDFQGSKTQNTRITDVAYDFHIYEGVLINEDAIIGAGVLPSRPVYTRSGLQENRHQVETELSYCSWYFWTVRARFRLNGVPRVTEWSGAYDTYDNVFKAPRARNKPNRRYNGVLGPHYSYYPLRTPTDPAWPACWDDLKVYGERRESRAQ